MFMQDTTRFVAAASAIPVPVLAAPVRSGLVAATLIDTATGWRAAGSLRRGDRLHSFDGGLRDVIAVNRTWLMPGEASLLTLPGGILNNAADLALLPGQHLLIDTWNEAGLPDALMALAPAEALIGLAGTRCHVIADPLEIVTPVFAEEEVIYANGGLLLHCPGAASNPAAPQDSYFTHLAVPQARALLRRQLIDAVSLSVSLREQAEVAEKTALRAVFRRTRAA